MAKTLFHSSLIQILFRNEKFSHSSQRLQQVLREGRQSG